MIKQDKLVDELFEDLDANLQKLENTLGGTDEESRGDVREPINNTSRVILACITVALIHGYDALTKKTYQRALKLFSDAIKQLGDDLYASHERRRAGNLVTLAYNRRPELISDLPAKILDYI